MVNDKESCNSTQQDPKHGQISSSAYNTDTGREDRPSDQTILSKKTSTLALPKWLYCSLPISAIALSVIISLWLTGERKYIVDGERKYIVDDFLIEKSDIFGWEPVDLFAKYDLDQDMLLSLEEAIPLLNHYLGETKDHNDSASDDVKPGEDVVRVKARFSPIDLVMEEWQYENLNYDTLYGLFNWVAPHIETHDFGASRFLDLLPDLDSEFAPGTVYTIVEGPSGKLSSISLPDRRFYPRRVVGRGRIIHRLLSMFHPRPFLVTRFPPQGILGCVRAVNTDYIEVVFRMHVEFQLNEPPRFPFWFTPSQFTGSLRMSRNGSKVEHFHLYVPNERSLNVEMELMEDDPKDKVVNIRYLPLMELISDGHPTLQRLPKEDPVHDVERQSSEGNTSAEIKWDAEISFEAAKDALELKLFPYTENHAADSSLPYSSIARSFADNYEFPVTILVALSNGTVVHKIQANNLLRSGPMPDARAYSDVRTDYVGFLREGIRKAEQFMQTK